MIETIQDNWLLELKQELKEVKQVKIVSPFITDNMVRHLLENFKGDDIQLITRFNLNDFRSGISSLTALERLLEKKATIKGVKGLHSKLYLFDKKSTIITSANFTNGGFFRNKEFGVKTDEKAIMKNSASYFQELWDIDEQILTSQMIQEWKPLVQKRKKGKVVESSLSDHGKSYQEKIIDSRKRYFIKFFGKNEHREELSYPIKNEIEYGCCHYALSFSDKKGRPRRYRDGDVVYMAKMLHESNYAIFGKGITIKHNDSRDIADKKDKKHVPWIMDWRILVRVHSTEFIDGTLKNCPKMSELIDTLDYASFHSTLNRYNKGERNIKPWNSLRQQADIKLSNLGAQWLEEKFQKAINKNGRITQEFIEQFYQGKKI